MSAQESLIEDSPVLQNRDWEELGRDETRAMNKLLLRAASWRSMVLAGFMFISK